MFVENKESQYIYIYLGFDEGSHTTRNAFVRVSSGGVIQYSEIPPEDESDWKDMSNKQTRVQGLPKSITQYWEGGIDSIAAQSVKTTRVLPKAEQRPLEQKSNSIKVYNISHPNKEPKGLYIVDFYNPYTTKRHKYRIYCPTNAVRDISENKMGKSRTAEKEDKVRYSNQNIMRKVLFETCK
jgi:hypothetical protein